MCASIQGVGIEEPGDADRFDVERRWLAAQAPVSIRDQI